MSTPYPICLVTGATEGVGKVTALELAKKGYTVVLAARNAAKAEATTKEIVELAGNERVRFLLADLASLQSVRSLAEEFRRQYPRLDVLINNAGVFLPARTTTRDGFETTFQVNYLSHFLLTQLLLREIEASPQGRIVNLSSSVHSIGKFEPDNLQSERRFSVLGTYAASKLFMIMFTRELARRLRGTRATANAVHPGIVRTPMMLNAPGAFRVLSYLSLPFSVSPQRGAATSVYVATSKELAAVSGEYFTASKRAKASNRADTPENRALLWDLSTKALQSTVALDALRAAS